MRPSASPAPSFRGLSSSSPQASRTHSKIRKTGSKAEVALRSALWRAGLRFRKNLRSLAGSPDVVFPSEKVVVFCDGDFWHGREWRARRAKLLGGANASYWIGKIEANILRDEKVSAALIQDGWRVLRYWESKILANPEAVASRVAKVVLANRRLRNRPGKVATVPDQSRRRSR